MARAVHIGGFGVGKSTVKKTAVAIAEVLGYEEVDYFTFSRAMDPDNGVKKAVQGVHTITHSAGYMALSDAKPQEVHAFNAPVPTSVGYLLAKTLVKQGRMTARAMTGRTIAHDTLAWNTSSIAELAAHPLANLRQLPDIAEFNSWAQASAANSEGIPTKLVHSLDDDYFRSTPVLREIARYPIVPFMAIEGQHDELAINPTQALKAVFG